MTKGIKDGVILSIDKLRNLKNNIALYLVKKVI